MGMIRRCGESGGGDVGDLDRAERILHYIEGKSKDDLVRDPLLQDAVLHCFLILGEAAAQISQPTKDDHPQLPRRSIVGIRDHIIHGYTRVNLGIIWLTARDDLPTTGC